MKFSGLYKNRRKVYPAPERQFFITDMLEGRIMLTGKQKRFLRGLGHGLKPVILVGKGEIGESLIQETTAALESHELIKVKILESCPADRYEVAAGLADACGAELAQVLGRTLLLYRKGEEPKIELPV
jgi:RNA-binding protein